MGMIFTSAHRKVFVVWLAVVMVLTWLYSAQGATPTTQNFNALDFAVDGTAASTNVIKGTWSRNGGKLYGRGVNTNSVLMGSTNLSANFSDHAAAEISNELFRKKALIVETWTGGTNPAASEWPVYFLHHMQGAVNRSTITMEEIGNMGSSTHQMLTVQTSTGVTNSFSSWPTYVLASQTAGYFNSAPSGAPGAAMGLQASVDPARAQVNIGLGAYTEPAATPNNSTNVGISVTVSPYRVGQTDVAGYFEIGDNTGSGNPVMEGAVILADALNSGLPIFVGRNSSGTKVGRILNNGTYLQGVAPGAVSTGVGVIVGSEASAAREISVVSASGPNNTTPYGYVQSTATPSSVYHIVASVDAPTANYTEYQLRASGSTKSAAHLYLQDNLTDGFRLDPWRTDAINFDFQSVARSDATIFRVGNATTNLFRILEDTFEFTVTGNASLPDYTLDAAAFAPRQSSRAIGTTANPWSAGYFTTVGLGIGDRIVRAGTGSPQSVTTAEIGSFYLRTDGGSGTTAYTKVSGSGNTGWENILSVGSDGVERVPGNIGANLTVGDTTFVDLTKASQTNSVSGALTFAHATNGIHGVSVSHERWFFVPSGGPHTLTIPSGWRTNVYSAVPPALTNGTITVMHVKGVGPTDSSANQTNALVSFEYYK